MTNSANDLGRNQSSETIELEVNEETRYELEIAASLNGQSVSDFIIATALNAARKQIKQNDRILLDESAWNKLCEILENPDNPTPELIRVMRS